MNTEESINNAIARMGPVARASLSKPRLDAFLALERHWSDFWRSPERATTPTVALMPRLRRYVQWYTRAWALLPETARAQVPRPDAIDPSFAQAARDTLSGYLTGVETTAQTAQQAQEWADRKADELRASIDRASQLGGTAFSIGAILGVIGVLWLLGRGR